MPRTTIAALLLLSAGCYHASIESGMKPGNEKIEKEWAASWVFGLVPPEPIEAQSKCATGVSKVETEHSFLNALVGLLTIQIYTPMHPLNAELRRRQEYGKPVEIGEDVWVGGGAIILPGVRIGSRTVIGAGSVVTRDVPDDVFAAGNPCRVIRQITE